MDENVAIVVETDNSLARDTLKRVEVKCGDWVSYGMDGRLTVDAVDWPRQENAGHGWRARFTDTPDGGDYGWGPLAKTREGAIICFLAEYIGATADMIEDSE